VEETVRPVEEHGFTLVDFLPDRVGGPPALPPACQSQSLKAIDALEPFFATEPGAR